jgi:hypothetical protein
MKADSEKLAAPGKRASGGSGRNQSVSDVIAGSSVPTSMSGNPLRNRDSDAYSRLLPFSHANGSVSAAGARPGLQNRGHDDVTPNDDKSLRKSTPALSTLCQRAESNSADFDPELQLVNEAWPTLPEALKAGILAMIRAASK